MRDRLRKERCGTLDQSQNDRSRACGGGFFSTLVAETRETLCSVYSYLRTTLAAGDVSNAVLAFDEDVRPGYQTLFGSISAANLPVAASRLGTIANGVLSPDYAELKVIKTFQGTTASFPMSYTRDEFGVWRIDSM